MEFPRMLPSKDSYLRSQNGLLAIFSVVMAVVLTVLIAMAIAMAPWAGNLWLALLVSISLLIWMTVYLAST